MGLCLRVDNVFKEMPSVSSSNKMETQKHLPRSLAARPADSKLFGW